MSLTLAKSATLLSQYQYWPLKKPVKLTTSFAQVVWQSLKLTDRGSFKSLSLARAIVMVIAIDYSNRFNIDLDLSRITQTQHTRQISLSRL